MTLSDLHIEFGEINALIWVLLFILTWLYEWCTVVVILKIVQLKSVTVANVSVLLNVIGMFSVLSYTNGINNCIPMLCAIWLANFVAIEREKRKK